MAFVISFTILLVPASATPADEAMDWWNWIKKMASVSAEYQPYQWWLDKWKSSDSSMTDVSQANTAYSNYVSTVQSALGTSTVGDNCVYLGNWSLDTDLTNSYFVSNGTFTSGSTFSWTCTYSTSSNWTSTFAVDATFVAPVSGTYVLTPFTDFSYSGTGNSTFSPNYLYVKTSSGTTVVSYPNFKGQNLSASLTAGVTYTVQLTYVSSGSSPRTWNIQGACRLEYPTGDLAAAAGSLDISTETRTGSLCGDYFYEGDDGTMVQAENIYLFDETNNSVTNPATGTTATASSWTYDYATRTYTITATDGSTYTIVSGDDAAAVTIKDSGNISTTYNYYYGTTTGGGSSGGDTESIWTKLGKLFGSITDGFLEVLKAFIGKLLDGLTSLLDLINSKIGTIVNSILSLFDNVPKLFTGFTAFLTAVFPFLPQEFFDILILGAALAAVILIIKMLKR